jgi:hypothetical protein
MTINIQRPIRIVPVTAFVDWNSQIHAAAPGYDCNDTDIARITLNYVGKILSSGLIKISDEFRFDVTLRIYHGWHRGFQATPRRKALTTIVAMNTHISTSPKVIFRPNIEFGDRLITASNLRLHTRINCHIPNTLRKSLKFADADEEKMVDTAIACDVVDLAHREPDRWLIILGEDDDLIPPIIVADGIRGAAGGKVALLRYRGDGPFFKI